MARTFRKYKGRTYPDKESRNRKPSSGCLNDGYCPWCRGNRKYTINRDIEKTEFDLNMYKRGINYDQ